MPESKLHDAYAKWLRTALRVSDSVGKRSGGHRYTQLVFLQHHRALRAVLWRLEERVGPASFETWARRFREHCPPNHPHPAMWARGFADWLCMQAEVPVWAQGLADDLVTRAQEGMQKGVGTTAGTLRAYATDPSREDTGPVVIFIQRDARGSVFGLHCDAEMVAAHAYETRRWTSQEAQARVGALDLARAHDRLRAARLAAGFVVE